MEYVYVIIDSQDYRVVGVFEDPIEAQQTLDELNQLFSGYFMYSVDFYGKGD